MIKVTTPNLGCPGIGHVASNPPMLHVEREDINGGAHDVLGHVRVVAISAGNDHLTLAIVSQDHTTGYASPENTVRHLQLLLPLPCSLYFLKQGQKTIFTPLTLHTLLLKTRSKTLFLHPLPCSLYFEKQLGSILSPMTLLTLLPIEFLHRDKEVYT